MLTTARQRLQKDDEDGFTLIELMVVVLIIAILLAIAIPTFLGAQDRARDRGAQSELRNALTAAKTIATDDAGLFTNVTAGATGTLATAEGSLTYAGNLVPATKVISVAVQSTNTELILQTKSASGTSFAICANSSGQVKYAKVAVSTYAGCTLDKF
jgi:type IV pilus assembly protein PilA